MHLRLCLLAMIVVFAGMVSYGAGIEDAHRDEQPLRGATVRATDATDARIAELKAAGHNTVVLIVDSKDAPAKQAIRRAAARVAAADLATGYWIEVARAPELADQHPEWMASLQTHDEWRRFFPDTKRPAEDEVVKTYPWVPILSRAPFYAQRDRVLQLLDDLPTPQLLFLNDLQGAPSACGCGNPLCRWTSDYGDRRTTVPLSDEAAAMFVKAIRKTLPITEIIPVWTTECEEHDGHPNGLCAGVGCYAGICWKAYTRQLMPVADTCPRLAVMAPYKELQRNGDRYGASEAAWVEFVVRSFATMPPRNKGTAIESSRVIAILQGWNVSPAEIAAQQSAASTSGANGYIVAYDKIEQSWSPKIVSWK